MTGNKEHGTRNKGFFGLLAWQKADESASEVYRTLGQRSTADRWLTSQTVRAAISVPANIAEGYGRGSLGDYVRFLDIAKGSLAEVEYDLHFMAREGILGPTEVARLQPIHSEAARLLHGLWKSLKEKTKDGTWNRTGIVSDNVQDAAYVVDNRDDGAIDP